jgi:hypothetical protein
MNKKGRTFVRPLIVMRFTRRHCGAQKGGATNLGSLSEPRREQNLSANPKRTAKIQSVRYLGRWNLPPGSKKIKLFFNVCG